MVKLRALAVEDSDVEYVLSCLSKKDRDIVMQFNFMLEQVIAEDLCNEND